MPYLRAIKICWHKPTNHNSAMDYSVCGGGLSGCYRNMAPKRATPQPGDFRPGSWTTATPRGWSAAVHFLSVVVNVFCCCEWIRDSLSGGKCKKSVGVCVFDFFFVWDRTFDCSKLFYIIDRCIRRFFLCRIWVLININCIAEVYVIQFNKIMIFFKCEFELIFIVASLMRI